MNKQLLLKNGQVLIGREFVAADLRIEDGRIEGIFPRENGEVSLRRDWHSGNAVATDIVHATPRAAERSAATFVGAAHEIDLNGARVIPGFIDIHTHGGFGVDFNQADGNDLQKVMAFFASQGVTAFLPTVMTDEPDAIARQLERIAQAAHAQNMAHSASVPCPRILGIHLEGPFLAESHRGAHPAYLLRPCDLGLFDELQCAAGGMIRIVTLSPELEGAIPFTRALAARGVRVSIGHSGASYEVAMAAIHAGANSATHIMNAMKLMHMHDPAILTAVLESDIYAEMICDGIHLHPAIVRFLIKAKGLDHMIAVTDSIMATGLSDGRYSIGGTEVIVEGGDAKLASNGMRAGSTLTMIGALRNLQVFSGRGIEELSRLVSENPAHMLGIDGDTGSIELGKRADLVALGAGDVLEMTMAGGQIAYLLQKKALQ